MERDDRDWVASDLTSADGLLSAPAERIFTLPRLWTYQLKARITQEVNFMTRKQNLAQLSSIDRSIQVKTSSCGI